MTALGALGAEPSQVDRATAAIWPSPPRRGRARWSRRCGPSTRREIPIADLALRRPSLDDVFLALTGRKTTAEDDGPRASARTTPGAPATGTEPA